MGGRIGGLLVAAGLLLSGCGAGSTTADHPSRSATATAAGSSVVRAATSAKAFPAAGVFDYQIGGAYSPVAGVRIVDRDRTVGPAPGRYNVCYINAYQAQPGDLAWWQRTHPSLLLRDARGRLVIDRDWNEVLLDISTAAKRAQVATVVGGWFAGCARSGYDAVEPDNLDSYTRSQGGLTQADAVAFAGLLAGAAHRNTLLIGQKNASELATRLRGSGYDFAVAEECQEYDECGAYTSAYGKNVIEIEYTASRFAQACTARRGRVSLLLRDRDVVPKGQAGYVSRTC